MNEPPVTALTIAGSDSSGGAGIQADLKTFSALGAYGMSAITALTAQNTQGVQGVHPVPPAFVTQQIDAVFDDVRVDAVKIGMLGSAAVVSAVAEALRRHAPKIVILDPVMVAKSGDRLLDEDAVNALRDELMPLANVITPNAPEAGVLLDEPAPTSVEALEPAAFSLRERGAAGVMLKGGHVAGEESIDIFVDAEGTRRIAAPRIDTRNTHGTGCTLSSAIAALAPQMASMADAAAAARDYLQGAMAEADDLAIGHGHGPVHHFYALWKGDPAEEALEW